ncbi:MAG: EAL domain-containing protein, partial [Gammaproteobacteria bacterium]|nr:EAL domain-containing protein [Gammaproteobacteria bacterium]
MTSPQIDAERLRFLYRQSRTGNILTLLVVAVLTTQLFGNVSTVSLSVWVGYAVFVTGSGFWLSARFNITDVDRLDMWRKLFIASTCTSGAVWGACALLFLPQTSIENQLMILLVIAALCATAVSYLAADKPAFELYISIAIFPAAVFCLTQSQNIYISIALLACVFIFAVLSSANHFHRLFSESLRFRFQNLELAKNLASRNHELEEDIMMRKQIEENLQFRIEMQSNIAELSAEFVRLGIDDIDQGIIKGLQRIGRFSGADRCYVFTLRDQTTLENTHEWCADGIESRKGTAVTLALSDLPWLISAVKAGKPILIPDTEDLPDTARAEREFFRDQAVLSCAIVPISLAGVIRGFIGFDSIHTERSWNDDFAGMLNIAGDLFVSALERKLAEDRIWYHANYDSLTGLPNRRLLYEHLERALQASEQYSTYGAILFLDLDEFKTINDSLGHPAGDSVLWEVAGRLTDWSKAEAIAGRLGGDEFVVLFSNLGISKEQSAEAALTMAKRIQHFLSQPYSVHGDLLHITASIGVALFPSSADSADSILASADTAMYHAKDSGRNGIAFFDPRYQLAAKERLRFNNEIRQAITLDDMRLYYQPQVNRDGHIVSAEALVRWQHPYRGVVQPKSFISMAEETGLITEIDAWTLRQACTHLTFWSKADDQTPHCVDRVAVNISPKFFHRPDFLVHVRQILDETNADPTRLEFEITERVLMDSREDAINKMQHLRNLGVQFSIDDFGTGYSSLSYLKHLPIDKIKIDQSFVCGISTD